MSVNPGFSGQEFIPSVLGKIREVHQRIRASGRAVRVEVDGGIKVNNIAQIVEAGADTIVAGSAIFGSSDYAATIRSMRTEIARVEAAARTRIDWLALSPRHHRHRQRVLPGSVHWAWQPGWRRCRRRCCALARSRPCLHLRTGIEDHDGLARGTQQALLFEDFEHSAGHLA